VWHQDQGEREQQGRRSTEHLCGGLCSGDVAIQLPCCRLFYVDFGSVFP
jgi:hypothetical protein